MTRDEAETFARVRLTSLAERRDPTSHADWDLLAEAAERAIAGDPTAITVFRRVFEQPGFAASASCMEIGFAALGLGLLADRASIALLSERAMPFNGIDDDVKAALVLLHAVR